MFTRQGGEPYKFYSPQIDGTEVGCFIGNPKTTARLNLFIRRFTMNAFRKEIRYSISLFIAVILMAAFMITPASADGPNPRIISNDQWGSNYGALGASWWQWAYSFPAAEVPFFNPGGFVDISAGQSG